MSEKKTNYSISVYDDHAIIKGGLSSDVLKLLISLCKKEGFTHIMSNVEGDGFKLIRKIND